MEKWKIDRINDLAHKKKTVGLTEAELTEQAALRREYALKRLSRGEKLRLISAQKPEAAP